MASVHTLCFIVLVLFASGKMARFSSYEKARFQDRVTFSSEQVTNIANRADYQPERISIIVNLTGRFVLDMYDCHNESGDSYTSILNDQIRILTLVETERLETRLRGMVKSVHNEKRDLNKKGSKKKREELLTKLKKVSIFGNECLDANDLVLSNLHFKQENANLKAKYNSVLESLHEAKHSVDDLEFQLGECETELTRLKAKNASLAKYMEKVTGSQEPDNTGKVYNPEDTGKPYDKCQRTQKNRKLEKLRQNANAALWFAESYQLVPKSVVLESANTGAKVTLDLDENDRPCKYNKKPSFEELPEDDQEKIKKLTLILDQFGVSDATYHELHCITDDLPTSSLIVQCRHDIEKLYEIKRLPGGKPGAYVSFHSELSRHIKKNPDDLKPKVKFAGDGTRVSKFKNFVILSFCPIKDGVDQSSKSHIVLAILCAPEDYTSMDLCFTPIIDEVNQVIADGIEVDGVHFSPEIFLGGDMKFLLTIMGMNTNAAASEYICLYCLAKKDDRLDLTKPWDYFQSDEMKRKFSHTFKPGLGGKYKPLINIDIDHIMPCVLHLLLRVTDILESNLALEMYERDNLAKLNQEPQIFVKDYVEMVNSCGVSYRMWESVDKHSKKVKYETTSLNGPCKLKLLRELPGKLRSSSLLHEETKGEICDLWDGFLSIYTMVTSDPTDDSAHLTLFEKAKTWIENCHSLATRRFGYDRNTPYMHNLLFHYPHLLKCYGNLNKFSGQGLEKLNDTTKAFHHHKSNKWDGEKQALNGRKRMEHLFGAERVPRSYEKHDEEYWSRKIFENRQGMKRKYEEEVAALNPVEPALTLESIEAMETEDIRRKLKDLNVRIGRIRAREKLVALLKSTIES